MASDLKCSSRLRGFLGLTKELPEMEAEGMCLANLRPQHIFLTLLKALN